jgi:integrase
MARSLTLEPRFVEGRNKPWKLWIPARLSPTGKVQELHYATKREAEQAAAALETRSENFGRLGTTLSADQLSIAGKAFHLLGDRADRLLEIITRHLEAEKRLAALPGGARIEDAVEAHIEAETERLASRPFGEVFDEFLEIKAGKSDDHKKNLRLTRERFDYLAESLISDIGPKDLLLKLKKFAPSSRDQEQRHLRAVFNFAIKRQWRAVGTNPVAHLDFSETENKEVEIFTVEQVEKMLLFALANDLALLPFLTLGFFCGIRSDGELPKLDWGDVHLIGDRPEVEIRPVVSKTRRRRFVGLSENALLWIEAYRQRGGVMTGPVVTYRAENLRNHRRTAQGAAGVTKWIQSGARHTFCSNWLAMHKDVNRLVLETGHTSASTMWEHYHRGTSETEAKKFWSVLPPAELINVIPIKKAQKTV